MPQRTGLYDVHGNAWQWVEDCYQGLPLTALRGLVAIAVGVLRGGSWDNNPWVLRAARRDRLPSSVRVAITAIDNGPVLRPGDFALGGLICAVSVPTYPVFIIPDEITRVGTGHCAGLRGVPLLAGVLIVQFGGYGQAVMLILCIYILGIAVTPLLPETDGKALLDRV